MCVRNYYVHLELKEEKEERNSMSMYVQSVANEVCNLTQTVEITKGRGYIN